MARVFFSYSHEDEQYRNQLEKHLATLQHEGLIETWHDRRILPGDIFSGEIDANLERADIVLLLVSASFIASRYCFGIEMAKALERREAGLARVIPVIVRPCDWSPLAHLQALPRDGKPITTWPNLDEAFYDVARELRRLLTAASPAAAKPAATRAMPPSAPSSAALSGKPRSSNLRVRKDFSDADKDDHLHEAFEFLAQFFEASLDELGRRNEGIRTRYRRVDANTFTASIYRGGQQAAECAIKLGGPFRTGGIFYSSDAALPGSSFNELLTVGNDDQMLFLKPTGMFRGDQNVQLSNEQAAEFYWDRLISDVR